MPSSAVELGLAAVEAENRKDLEALIGLCSEDLVWHLPGQDRNLDQLRDVAAGLFAGYPDRTVTVHDSFSEGNRAVVRFTATAHAASDGQEMKQTGIEIFSAEDGKITEIWSMIARID